MEPVPHSVRSSFRGSPRLATLVASTSTLLLAASPAAAQIIDVVINNGLAPPNAANVVSSASEGPTYYWVQNASCDVMVEDPCAVPGDPTTVAFVEEATPGQILVRQTSHAVVDMPGSGAQIQARESATALLLWARMLELAIWDDAEALVEGGTYQFVRPRHSARVVIAGGEYTEVLDWRNFLPHDDSQILVLGSDFEVDGSAVPPGPIAARTGTLTGILESGEAFSARIGHAGYAVPGCVWGPCTGTIVLPEPDGRLAGGVALIVTSWLRPRAVRRRRRRPPRSRARRAFLSALLVVLLGLALGPLAGCGEPATRSVRELPGGHALSVWEVSETRVGSSEVVEELAAALTSRGGRPTRLLVQVSSSDPAVVVTDGSLVVPAGAAWARTEASDTFAIRRDRRASFDRSSLRFRLLDPYGGDLSIGTTATGRFRVEEIDGRSFFVTPDGHAFWSSGLSHVIWHGDYSPPIQRRPYHEAVLAKYGDEAGWAAAMEDRLRAWNINTVGAWSNDHLWPTLPYTPVMSLNRAAPEVPGWPEGQTGQRIRDYFDPAFEAGVASRAGDAVACAADPFCIGVFSDNELPFGRSVLQIGTYVDAYLTLPAGAPGKLALQAFFEERYGGDLSAFNTAWSLDLASFDAIQDLTGLEPDSGFCNEAGRRADRQAFVARAAARYFAVVDAALEAISPELLYLGTRFLAVYTAPAIYEAAAPHVDVVSINDYDWDENGRGLFRSEGTPYGYLFLDDPVSDLDLVHALTGKPLMITEWTVRTNRTDVDVLFPPFMPTADSQAERADRYEAFMEALLERPYMVGAHWFKFHDQPATGRGDGENSKFGVVDIEDTPYATLVERMAAVNARLYDPPAPADPRPPARAPASAASRAGALGLPAPAGAPAELGCRRFSIAPPDAERTGFYAFILPGTNLANAITGDDLVIDAGAPDAAGVAPLALAEAAVVAVEAVTGELACFDLRAAGSSGELACEGGFGHDVAVSLGTGQLPLGDSVTEPFLGADSGPGAATLQVPLRFVQLPPGATVADCAEAAAEVDPVLAAFTTATVTTTKGVESFDVTGEPFVCGPSGEGWRAGDGPGMWVVGLPLFDGRVPGGDLAAAFAFADSQVACRP